ncbi:MAG: VWA domain-containing protein [Fibrobacterales bacterium]
MSIFLRNLALMVMITGTMNSCIFSENNNANPVSDNSVESSSDQGDSSESNLSSEATPITPLTVVITQTKQSTTLPSSLPEITAEAFGEITLENPETVTDTTESTSGALITRSPIRDHDFREESGMSDEMDSDISMAPSETEMGGGSGGTVESITEISKSSDAVFTDLPLITDDVYIEEVQAQAQVLTASEWYDHAHWPEFREFIYKYPEHYQEWNLKIEKRIIITVTDSLGTPIPDAQVNVSWNDMVVSQGRTTAGGTVALFPIISEQQSEEFELTIFVDDAHFTSAFEATSDDDQTWTVTLPIEQVVSVPAIDIVFTVDVTGSMGDELEYLKQELLDITAKIEEEQIAGLRIGLMFYKDRTDNFITKGWDFSSDLQTVQTNLETMSAGGGGDTPESVNQALKESFQKFSWSESGAVRLNFLIADAPPHYYEDEQYTYSDAIREASQKGVKIITVAASGISRSTEYLFRSISVATMGKYIFLTDHSGVGGSHLEADVSDVTVETLNDILTRTIKDEIALWPTE